MGRVMTRVRRAARNTLQNIRLDTDTVSGEIAIPENNILCVATPYGRGWNVEVDGEEKPLLCVNKHYLGVELSAGEHTVSFRYSTPLKQAGFFLSLGAIALSAALTVVYEGNRRKEKTA